MKLIDREPTEEMLFAARFYKEGQHTLACAWRAMYDAAPDIQQEPIGYIDGHYGFVRTKEGINMPIGARAYTFPPDAQVEIAKRDGRIKELEADQDKANAAVAIGNYLGKTYNYAWCDTSLASQTIDLLKEQSAEISRLKEVIAKCQSALAQCKQWKEGANTLTCHNHEAVEEALCMIKEIEK